MFYVQGITYPKYFLKLQDDTAKDMYVKTAMGGASGSSGYLKIYAGSTGYNIALYAAT